MIEKANGNGYRATAMTPTPLVAEAPSREEVLNRIRDMIAERVSHAEWVQVEVPVHGAPDPWLAIAGTWRDRPDIDEVQANIEAYRREVDAAPDRI